MIAADNEVCLVCVGASKGPNKFKYWTWWHDTTREGYQRKQEYLSKIRWKGFGYGYAYYYSHGKIWFRNEKHLTMYLLMFSDEL